MPDPTIADLLARHLNRIVSGLGSDNDAQAIAQAIAAQADRLDVLEAVVADRVKVRPLTEDETRAEIERLTAGRCRACLRLTGGETCHCENDE